MGIWYGSLHTYKLGSSVQKKKKKKLLRLKIKTVVWVLLAARAVLYSDKVELEKQSSKLYGS